MANPSISMPDEMEDEIDRRRPSTKSRAQWIREAIQARFDAEDQGEWEKSHSNDDSQDSTVEA